MQTVNVIRRALSLPDVLREILPLPLLDALARCGAPRAEEIRLHTGRFATVTCNGKNYFTDVVLREDEVSTILKRMCKDSLYAYTQHINEGYLSLAGGIRVGVCGNARLENGRVIGVSDVSGLMIRIPHPPRLSAAPLVDLLKEGRGLGGLLIYAPPGIGKTTLLRALASEISHGCNGWRTVAVDTREELFPVLGGEAKLLDVLVGYPRAPRPDISSSSSRIRQRCPHAPIRPWFPECARACRCSTCPAILRRGQGSGAGAGDPQNWDCSPPPSGRNPSHPAPLPASAAGCSSPSQ